MLPTIWGKLNKNYAWELSGFHFYRRFKEGITTSFLIEGDWYKGDHCPRFSIFLVLFNFTIFEFTIYNIHHVEENNE